MKHLMKKAVKAAVFAALTTLALTAFASAEGEMAIGAGCTTGTSLRMRSEPNTSSAIVTTLNKSVAVALLDDSVPGWYKINYNGSTGYVSSDYLIIDQDNIFTTYGRCAPFGRCPWTDVVVHAPRPRCRTSGKSVRFQRSGCRTANGQGVVFGRHIHLWPENWGEYLRQVNFIEKFACFCSLAKVNASL